MDARPGYTPSSTEGPFNFVTWFKGDPKLINYGAYKTDAFFGNPLNAFVTP